MCPINTMRGPENRFLHPAKLATSRQSQWALQICREQEGCREIDSVFPISHFPDRSVVEDGDNLIVESTSADGVFLLKGLGGWILAISYCMDR